MPLYLSLSRGKYVRYGRGVEFMIDLSSTLFFKAKFEITAKQEDFDMLWCVVCHIRNWMSRKWRRKGDTIPTDNHLWSKWKMGSRIVSQNDSVRFQSMYHHTEDGGVFWACKIHESFPSRGGYAPRQFTTEVGFQAPTRGKATISIIIYYSDRPGFIGPCEDPVPASIPNLIRYLCEDPQILCTADSHPLPLQPIHLKPGDFPEFWNAVADPKRSIPVIYISPRISDTETAVNLVDPKELSDCILGPNALVYYATDLDFSHEMTQMCPRDYGCYSGSIRIYAPQPRIGEEREHYRHRFILAHDILDMGSGQTCEILRRALAQDVHFYDEMFRVEDCQKMRERCMMEARLAAHKKAIEDSFLETTVQTQDELKAKCQAAENALFEKELEFEEYKETASDEIKELRRQVHNWQQKAENHQKALLQEREHALKDLQDSVKSYPAAPVEIANFFISHFPGRIDFTDNGFASLRSCETDAETLWDALYQMVTTLYDLYFNEGVSDVTRAFNSRSSNLRMARGEGKMTRQDHKLMRQYQDTYHGKSIDIEAHIKTSESRETSKKFLRIYFDFYKSTDPHTHKEINTIVIGSCGKHLDNYTTQKLH